MSPARILMPVIGAVLIAIGVWLIAHLRRPALGERQRYGYRIAGVIALAAGACLITFATTFAVATR